ncbi:MAG TPA: HdeA/HdeB family chaperone [Stellaceae bacterium]|nr:HdeA/HdeB family chaperone [Stellaceae bacterium]
MKTASLVFVAVLFAAIPAFAQVIDLNTVKCKEFVTSGKDDMGVILTWLGAYYREDSDPPVIDLAKFKENARKLGAFCGANPTLSLITAADTVLAKKK